MAVCHFVYVVYLGHGHRHCSHGTTKIVKKAVRLKQIYYIIFFQSLIGNGPAPLSPHPFFGKLVLRGNVTYVGCGLGVMSRQPSFIVYNLIYFDLGLSRN